VISSKIQSEGLSSITTTGDQSNQKKRQDEDSWLTIYFIFFNFGLVAEGQKNK
jgi:hypothetical protein